MTPTTQTIYGLILAGGFSKRMGQDKALLNFHGKPQVNYLQEILQPFCQTVYCSLRADQLNEEFYQSKTHLVDLPQFQGIGPLGGILSALTLFPQAAWLVLACDLPFVTGETLAYLLSQRDPAKIATAFRSAHDDLPEPLCAVWEPPAREAALRFLKEGIHCPRKVLIKADTHLITQQDERWLKNVNTREEYQLIQCQLKRAG